MGHAAFIWWAYGATAILLPGLLIASLRSLRAREAELEAADEGRGRRRRDAGP
jgi:heme exporter protein CcmD